MARELVAKGGGSALVAAAGGDPSAVTGTHVGTAAARAIPTPGPPRAVRRERRARPRGPREHPRSECIVIAGGLVELGPLLFGPLREAFGVTSKASTYRPSVAIVPAQLGERAGAVGAAVLARSLQP